MHEPRQQYDPAPAPLTPFTITGESGSSDRGKERVQMADARTDLIDALARQIETSPLTQAEIDSVLELAAVAAQGTGDRTSAPLASFLAGIAAASAQNRIESLNELRRHAVEITGG